MPDRGAIYMVWGNDEKVERALERSLTSLAAVHPELPVEVIRVDVSDRVKGLLEKASMFERSPFRETVFLDVDTVVLSRLDFAFEKARIFGLACAICECPWARRHAGVDGDVIEYNSGVMFFTELARPIFARWASLAPVIDSSLVVIENGKELRSRHADQGSFAAAIDELNFSPFVLPMNWNFRPGWYRSFFGPLKIWHDYADVPQFFYELSRYYSRSDAIIQYHAGR